MLQKSIAFVCMKTTMMKKPIQFAGYAALILALTYVFMFVLYGAIIEGEAPNSSAQEVLENIQNNYRYNWSANFVGYILFGAVLVFLTYGLQKHQRSFSPHLSTTAAVFGYIWSGLVIASGMIGNILLQDIMQTGPETAENSLQLVNAVSTVTEGLGGGNEFVGGIWSLLVSIAFLKNETSPKALIILGTLVGISGIATLFPIELFTEIFGMSQLLWFFYLGVFLLRRPAIEITN